MHTLTHTNTHTPAALDWLHMWEPDKWWINAQQGLLRTTEVLISQYETKLTTM